jgi:spermidine/putrescine-binding protein
LGILYNENDDKIKKVSGGREKKSWKELFEKENVTADRNLLFKASPRDAFTVAMLNHYRAELLADRPDNLDGDWAAFDSRLNTIFNAGAHTPAMITTAENSIRTIRTAAGNRFIPSGDDQIMSINETSNFTHGSHDFGLFWSCDIGYLIMAEDNYEITTNTDLRWVVPDEGSNVWMNSFAIPSNAGNPAAANAFIRFLTRPDIARRNMLYTGATTSIHSTYTQIYNQLTEIDNELTAADGTLSQARVTHWTNQGLAFYLRAPIGFRPTIREALFPSQATLRRSGSMRDFGVHHDALDQMWFNATL